MNTRNEQLGDFSAVIVRHTSFTEATQKILRAVEITISRREPSAAMLVGKPGSGKTTICKSIVQHFGPGTVVQTEQGVVNTVPALYCSVPAGVTLKSLSVHMLTKLGCQDLRGDAITLMWRLSRLLSTCETQVILLDEFHHLLMRGAEKTRAVVCDWIKTLMNETLIPIILVGMPECEVIVDDHPQLARRYPYRARLPEFDFAVQSSNSIFIKTLKLFNQRMNEIGGFENSSILTDRSTASAIYVATSGNMNAIRQLLHDALRIALERADSTFTVNDLAEAAASLTSAKSLVKGKNPFLLSLTEINRILATR
jgi:ABC-type dipeptide/oligopeptide/nickel transport system ATPase component